MLVGIFLFIVDVGIATVSNIGVGFTRVSVFAVIMLKYMNEIDEWIVWLCNSTIEKHEKLTTISIPGRAVLATKTIQYEALPLCRRRACILKLKWLKQVWLQVLHLNFSTCFDVKPNGACNYISSQNFYCNMNTTQMKKE